ncbi:TIGR01777 family protein [Halobacteriovorax marinus]|uniref:TIGR01777 family oxidoreductase n=1 Tax=Halobacteriovorax marinus TaxID=97084 RepID=UPI000BC2F826|nr:TIGR01777 family oxidoreductase [Halobacteriovorax marinus]ATH08701.1 TIGR01777 family protein [Halobacteriovorax marinus]
MKILITGATGLVGKRLLEKLFLSGFDDVRILSTSKKRAQNSIPFPVEVFEWSPLENKISDAALENIDIVFHLAGESVADGRWSKQRKERILNSRVNGTRLLLDSIQKSNSTPQKFITASAVGIYGQDLSDKVITEESPLDDDFLADVCRRWENTLFERDIEGMKVHSLRTGIVLSNQGGALQKMLPPFKMGAGGILGSGKQYMSWIHIDDLVDAYIFLMKNDCKEKAYNGVSPTPLTNYNFTKVLGAALKRPTIFPVPAFVLKGIFGEMSDILLKGQRVIPKALEAEGFEFKYEKLGDALDDILKYEVSGEVLFKRYQWVESSKDKVFDFFKEAKNLEKITPEYLNFKILHMNTDNIQAGSLIDYKLQVHGIPMKWKTKISEYEEGKYFIDEQLKGPYSKWVHRHEFIPHKNGTLISDKVVYKIPLGILGKLAAGWFVKKDVNNIFNYRNKAINNFI